MPSAEALDSDAMIEVAPAVPAAAKTERMPDAPTSSAPSVAKKAAPPPTKTTKKMAKAPDAPIPLTSADPFRDAVPAAEPSEDDLELATKKPSKNLLYAGIGGVALLAIVLFVKLGSSSDEATTKPTPPVAVGPAVQSPTSDIPPPPPKDEDPTETAPAAKATEAPAAKATEAAAKATEAPAAKATEAPAQAPPAVTAKTPEPPKTVAATPAPVAKTPEPPKTVAATPAPPKPKAATPATTPAAPKTPPKSTGGGIVRDSPF